MRLLCNVAPVEVPRLRAHRVEPVLLPMFVSGHGLAGLPLSAASPDIRRAQPTMQSSLGAMARGVYRTRGNSLRRPLAAAISPFGPLTSWRLSPCAGPTWVRSADWCQTLGQVSSGDQAREGALGRAAVRRAAPPQVMASSEMHLLGVTLRSKIGPSELNVSELSRSARPSATCAHLTRKGACHMELPDK